MNYRIVFTLINVVTGSAFMHYNRWDLVALCAFAATYLWYEYETTLIEKHSK